MTDLSTKGKRRVFSGMQPSGKLHIGNYLGALKRWAAEQHEKENFFCIVDMHAITVPQDPEKLRAMTRDVAAVYMAAGLDPEISTIFIQSHVSEHAELCWVLNTVTPVGWMERMTQYKTKSQQQESVGMGLLDYPVLQAADILLYDAHEVPVGEDQKQHVEISRDIAQRFNYIYGETFVLPEPVIPKAGARIMALNDPARKMSKSEEFARGHAIHITDEPDEIRYVVKTAVTDSGREIVFSDAPEKAGVNNMLVIYQLLTGQPRDEIEAHFNGKGYGDLKKEFGEVVVEGLRPIRERYHELISDPAELDRLLAIGAGRAREIAEKKMDEVKEKIGFILPGKN
ncbi:MAG: tryptophan--tRNA ligase [Chloroflexi bacterium]|nr:MAG: tryptophan--tRNA ligase [Chloroflexota bacterium]